MNDNRERLKAVLHQIEQDFLKEHISADYTVCWSEPPNIVNGALKVSGPTESPNYKTESEFLGFFCSKCGGTEIPEEKILEHIRECIRG